MQRVAVVRRPPCFASIFVASWQGAQSDGSGRERATPTTAPERVTVWHAVQSFTGWRCFLPRTRAAWHEVHAVAVPSNGGCLPGTDAASRATARSASRTVAASRVFLFIVTTSADLPERG